jgi:hypothetical protein
MAARRQVPDWMPIVNPRMAEGDYRPYYTEREIIEPVDLCVSAGLAGEVVHG